MAPGAEVVELLPHRATPCSVVRRLGASVRWERARLSVVFRLEGDVSRIRVPSPAEPRIVDGLWRRTCFEAFVSVAGDPGYREWNLSPSGEWAVHVFGAYREGGILDDPSLDPGIAFRADERVATLEATLRLGGDAPARLRIGLSAVIEVEGGALSYWALRHPADRPDFHHADSFAHLLEPPPGNG